MDSRPSAHHENREGLRSEELEKYLAGYTVVSVDYRLAHGQEIRGISRRPQSDTMSNRGHGFDREMEAPAVAAAFESLLAFLKKYLPPNCFVVAKAHARPYFDAVAKPRRPSNYLVSNSSSSSVKRGAASVFPPKRTSL